MNSSIVRALRGGLLAACLAALLSAFAVGPASATTNYSDYTVYGEDGVHVGVDTDILGLVGARNQYLPGDQTLPNDYAINLNGGTSTQIIGSARSGGSVRLQNNAKITDTLFRPVSSTLTLGANATVAHDVTGDPDLPASWPPPVATLTCPTGGADDSGANGESRTVTPGVYGDYNFGSGFTLTLDGAGDYYFDSISTANSSEVKITSPGVRVFVCGSVDLGAGGISTGATKPSDLTFEVHGAGLNAFVIGGGVNWVGNIFAPNGFIHLGSGGSTGTVFGQLVAKSIDLEHSLVVKTETGKSGTKFEDVNGNGQRDQGEPGLPGFTIYVDYNNNGQPDAGEPSAVTGADGYYSIKGIDTGTWHVREVQQSGYDCTLPAAKDQFGCFYNETFTDGEQKTGNDFGNYKKSVPCTPGPGQNPDCTPVVTNCVPTAGQDQNCQPVVTPSCVPKAGEDKNCNKVSSKVDSSKVSGLKGGCTSTQRVRVSGTNIKKVTYKIDGKTVKTVKKAPFSYLLKTKDYKTGAHRLTVTTTFKSGKKKTKKVTFQHCKSSQPKFTG